MANRRNLSHADIAKLIEASDSEEVSEYENHTSDAIESESSNNDFDTGIQQMSCKGSIQSKNREIKWKLDPLPHSSQSTADNIIKTTPGVTRYTTTKISDVKSAFDIVFNSTIENEIINMTNIGRKKVYRKMWKNIESKTFQAYIGLLLLAGVYKSHEESTKSLWDKETGRNIFRATISLETFCNL
ncbi:hypothetical protein HNY73_014788 [Argiope bruennichi]|uniref:PiggyBac transposable element-derived protein domain-containing protein n=1 Tax=Argiope bruennichi TaxID=94029 RepID=A0A8T0EQ45_ARGBR|nr:hypothetical protein HNY73_014788 [Argiope bruennichi]